MEQNKDLKDNQFAFIFNYDNFINKSSQQRYYELKTEVKDKLDRIKDEVNIAGASEKEKKYNLLMHYKQLLEGLDYSKEGKKDNFQILSSYNDNCYDNGSVASLCTKLLEERKW